MNSDKSFSLSNPKPPFVTMNQKIATAISSLGMLLMLLAALNVRAVMPPYFFWLSISLLGIGIIWYAIDLYKNIPAGIKNNGIWFDSITNKGLWAWMLGIFLTAFYIILYWYPHLIGYNPENGSTGLVAFFNPLSRFLKGQPATQWFVYGTLYTCAILFFGIKFILKYRHNRYQIKRTLSVMFFQLCFAFLLPEILEGLNADKPYFNKDFKNIWPLHYYFYYDWHLNGMLEGGKLGMFTLIWGILLTFLITPILTYFYGKRWYCSWVCGCGGLAETAGDPFRHLSDKSLKAWQIERYLIHSVLVFAVVMTIFVLYTFFTGQGQVLFINTYQVREWYGFLIGATFSGVVGVGFYPLMGNRVWCRFGCPMAAILGIQQKYFSKFRITTNGGQCISCGNCSTYCEMGIDVRWYAQRGQDVVRASCVGCGICSAVCPRGVLRLENSKDIFGKAKKLRTEVVTSDVHSTE
ncbi:4Fe-4S binding protein [Membranihabitans maritimus]|uniref:4Fe-4S binding protein n=1 Tax=Membranihabitans maritimus TaxID=2904244 RepID=UPI001F1ED4D2|nr:4Fe-4S dicluster domain-containing protein [Membranihabitans maritimus]